AVGGCAGNDQFRPVFVRGTFHRVVVDRFGFVEPVGDDAEPASGEVQRHAVRQVTAFGEAHPHDGVTGLQEREEYGLVGLRARMRLDVGAFGAEQLPDAIDGELLGDVDVFAATVIPPA